MREERRQKSRGLPSLKLVAIPILAILISIFLSHRRLKSLPSLQKFAVMLPPNKDNDYDGRRRPWHRIPTRTDQNRYNRLRNNTNPTTTMHNSSPTNFTRDRRLPPEFKFVFRGVSGLGHRLVRMSAMYHAARIYQIPELHVSWGWECGENEEGNPDIFDHLFGLGPMVTDPRTNLVPAGQALPSERGDTWKLTIKNEELRIVNDVPRHKLFSSSGDSNGLTPRTVLEKTIPDEQFYRQLFGIFRFRETVQQFTERHFFAKRQVLGIHVRAGNGEEGDFEGKNRGFHDIDLWVLNIADSLRQLVRDMRGNRTWPTLERLPPLLFVATDDHKVLDKLANVTTGLGFQTLGFPQHHLEHGKGVTWTSRDKSTCHSTWVAQFTDAVLLGVSDAIVAGRYSSFTQSLPLVTLLADSIQNHASNLSLASIESGGDNYTSKIHDLFGWPEDVRRASAKRRESGELYQNRIFCESNILGDKLMCYDDYFDWLYSPRIPRRQISKEWPPHSKEVQYPCPDIC